MNEKRTARRLEKRLARAITGAEAASLTAGIVLGFAAWIFGSLPHQLLFPGVPGIGGILLFLVVGLAVPTFLSMLLAMLTPSWRYKIIAGVLLLFIITGFLIRDAVESASSGFLPFVGALIRFSTATAAALCALAVWQKLRTSHSVKDRASQEVVIAPGARMPRTSILFVLLSLVSIPAAYAMIILSMFVTIGLSAMLYMILSEINRVPIAIIGATLFAPVLAGIASIKAVVSMVSQGLLFQPGYRLDMTSHPALKKSLGELCARVGTRVPDNVMLVATPTFYVTQGRIRTLDGVIRGRTLALGLPLVKVLEANQTCCIIAHELAHFAGRDTIYSVLTSPVYRGLETAMNTLSGEGAPSRSSIETGTRILQLPALQLLISLFTYFHSINMVVSRSRESRADWIAARIYGRDAHVAALKKAVTMAPHFQESMERLRWQDESAFFSAYTRLFVGEQQEQERYLNEAMEQGESELNSHPSLRTRIASLPDLAPTVVETRDFLAELAEDEARLSREFSKMVAAARADSTGPRSDSSSAEASPTGGTVHCKTCDKMVAPTFQGCCPECGEFLEE